MALSTVTVTGTYKNPDTTVAAGRVEFRLNYPIQDLSGKILVDTAVYTAKLDGSGAISIALYATDCANTLPANNTYNVREILVGSDPRVYNMTLPNASPGGTLDLSTVVPATILTGPQAVGLPAGGTIGQSLAKNSSTDYDVSWQTIAGGSSVTSVSGTAPIASSGGTTPAISISPATTGSAGSLSAADKTKLDGVTAGAAVASVSGSAPISSSGGTTPAISISAATTGAAGSMSAADKTKLDGIATGATVGAAPSEAFVTIGNTAGLSAERALTQGTGITISDGGANSTVTVAFNGTAPGLTGATAATRYVGGTASGAPASGTFAVGDFVITQAGSIYICTAAGSPGTWTAVSGGGGAATSEPFVTIGNTAGLSAERALTQGTGITLTDGGANSTATIAFNGTAPGLTGATAATRYVGGTASVAPTSGTFAVGDFVIAQTGAIYICTAAGTPGTWTAVSGGASPWSLLYTNDGTMTDWTADVGTPTASGGIITLDAVTGAYHYMHCNPLGSARASTTKGMLPVKVTFDFRIATIGADQRLGCIPWTDTNSGPLYYFRHGVSGAGQQECATENHNATTYRLRIPDTTVANNTWRTMTVYRDFGKVGGMLDGDTTPLGDMSGWTTHIDNPRFYIVWYGNNTMEIRNFKIYGTVPG